jgi:hypothetical protein
VSRSGRRQDPVSARRLPSNFTIRPYFQAEYNTDLQLPASGHGFAGSTPVGHLVLMGAVGAPLLTN